MKWMPDSDASARAHSAGSPVMNASNPRAIASWTLRAPPPETLGPRALGEHLREHFGVAWTDIDVANPV